MQLALFACNPERSAGRIHPEGASRTRSLYQRDRDRIVHCAAFRRLKHKTQVFVYHEGDHYRTRLTHTLEVAQISRSIARSLGLNEDLTEAIALSHDLGHTPFGHAGEEALDRCMRNFGGFDHNAQALRLVTSLEGRYAAFRGLNLTIETLEGLVKHNGPLISREKRAAGETLPDAVASFEQHGVLRLESFAPAEAQVAALSDDIAYNAHDMDDGLRASLFGLIDIADVRMVGDALNDVVKRYPDLEPSRMIFETMRRIITRMVEDLLRETRSRLAETGPQSPDDVRDMDGPLVAFSNDIIDQNASLKEFLRSRMYHSDVVLEKMERAKAIVKMLFEAYVNDPARLPESWRDGFADLPERSRMRRICDFIAGMTDRYALDEHRRLFDLDPLFR